MSTDISQKTNSPQVQAEQAIEAPILQGGTDLTLVQDVLDKVQGQIAPVWPLKDYVAVNPYQGLADRKFLAARKSLRSLSDVETFMPVDYYRQLFADRTLVRKHIDAAVDEMVADGITGAERIDVNQVVTLLREQSAPSPTSDTKFSKADNPTRPLCTFAELLDRNVGSNWSRLIIQEISKHCASHYDQGQAAWASPWRELPLFQAWHAAAKHDRSFEIEGGGDVRGLVRGLPHDLNSALVMLLRQLGLPSELWADYLLCEALTMPGWSAWTRYQQLESERAGEENADFAALLAMRLTYEVALSEHYDFHVNWSSVAGHHASVVKQSEQPTDDDLLRYALLKASEISFRENLLSDLCESNGQPTGDRSISGCSVQSATSETDQVTRCLAQMVFCIDVRSERVRRQLESSSSEIQTYGFAGFFGLPIELVSLGESEGSSQVPALITPQFKVHEQIADADSASNLAASERRSKIRFWRKAWKEFQTSAASTFSFVETTGLFYGLGLFAKSIGFGKVWQSRYDGLSMADRERTGPSIEGLAECGISPSKQTELAESILRGIGIVDDFSRLVAFCGHGSQTENNPLQAGLDCGACGGHSGEANARLAAKLLNQPSIRQALAERGIEIPDSTHFVAALHNTTSDQIKFFDTHDVPRSHVGDLADLDELATQASQRTRHERLRKLPGPNADDLDRRSRDWSEVRPEWGLAGNAAFIVAPRELTKSISLDGRSFLHSYDYRNDPDFAVLEQIMTAPMIVANWINMQYYASTVDPIHFGSGNKTVHNVVGQFGVLSGNGGDLMTGLPWQSVHDGESYQHHPLRLLAVIAAPREAIEAIVAKHQGVADLLANGWMQLVAFEDGNYYRYTEQQSWENAAADLSQPVAH